MVKNSVFLIDAGYLSFITRFLGRGNHLKFRIENFVKNISKRTMTNCEIVYFYTAPPYQSASPTEKENQKTANYDKFISRLKNVKNSRTEVRSVSSS